ncbi:uracil-DNA glycosylase [Aquibium microcysteis]|uniref:uracil-DNA glycosylase n=1 Tax=Aquibium microcysteis TaxID=675281 RepID=UPI001EF231D6|nr:uracil-DNA glycosylase [Aquibium microcysteis]
MAARLVDALRDVLAGWQDDVPASWIPVLRQVELGFDGCDPSLDFEAWEPIFPSRRARGFPGAPAGAHMLRAFDGIDPDAVRCVVLGQDPYPEPGFATGRAFEAGNVAAWRELDKMFSRSVRAYMQQICAARTGRPELARSFGDWPGLLSEIEAGSVRIEPPGEIADRWVREGVLLLNSSLTLSRFRVEVDPHQSRGHLPVWRPLIQAVLRHLAASGRPIVYLGFGDAAAENLRLAGLDTPRDPQATFQRPHPAFADDLFSLENPFVACNRHLAAAGLRPIGW